MAPAGAVAGDVTDRAGGAEFKADVRVANPISGTPLETLTTADGTIARVDDDTIELTIPGTSSATWSAGIVALDVVRTDGVEPAHLGFTLYIPVTLPVTSAT